MRAVIIATGDQPQLEPLNQQNPSPLLRIVDRPILFHILEFLKKEGITKAEIIVHHLPEQIEQAVGSGQRWGMEINYHLIKDPAYPFALIQHLLPRWDEEHLLLAQGDLLPDFTLDQLQKNPLSLLFFSSKHWSEWGHFPKKVLANLPPTTTLSSLPTSLRSTYKKLSSHPHLSARSFADLQKTNQRLLLESSSSSILPSTARMIEPGIWLSKAVSLAPSVKIKAPVFIGEHCQINEQARIGPNTVIENHCIIDKQTIIENSLVCQNSYLGEGLEVRNSIVDKNHVINLTLNSTLAIDDECILGELASQQIPRYQLTSRALACLLILLFSPLLLLLAAFRKIDHIFYVQQPAHEESDLWKTFSCYHLKQKRPKPYKFLSFLVMLLNVVKGNMRVVGIKPRTAEELKQLPDDWRAMILSSKVGIITPTEIECDEQASTDDLYAAEAYYVSQNKARIDMKLFLKWLWS